MASKNFNGVVRNSLGALADSDKFRFTHVSTTGEVIRGSTSYLNIGEDGKYNIDIEYGNVFIESYSELGKRWIAQGTTTINADTTATTLPALLNALVPASDALILQLEALLADAESAATSAVSSATSAEQSAIDAALSATDNTEVIKSILVAQGFSGEYGFFADGFTYVNEGDVGISTDNKIWLYVGAGAPNKVVTAGTVPSEPDYKQVTFNSASGVKFNNGSSVQDFKDETAPITSKLNTFEGASIVGANSGLSVQEELDTLKNTTAYWYTAGDGVAPDIIFDATNDLGLNVTGNEVDSIVNLGKVSEDSLLPTSATKSPVEIRSGFKSIKFDGGVTYESYKLTSSYANGFFSSTKNHALNVAYVNNNIEAAESLVLNVGKSGDVQNRLSVRDPSNPIAYTIEYNDGVSSTTKTNLLFGGFDGRSDNTITTVSTHYDSGVFSHWINGAAMFVAKSGVFDIESASVLAADTISIGALNDDTLPLNGNIIAASIDNNEYLTLDDAYQKAKAMFLRFGGAAKPSIEIGVFGQSNAAGKFPNANPYNFAAGEAYYYESDYAGARRFIRGGFGHSTLEIGDSCPAIWFAAELKKLTGLTPLFQDLTFSGEPISPALGTGDFYQCPKNAVGDAAGQTSRIYQWSAALDAMRKLCDYSPEFNVVEKVAYFMCGEADARSIADLSSGLTKDELKGWLNSWLDSLSANYGFRKFAIVNIGRRGVDQTEINHYASAIGIVRGGISEVIAERSDCYDVFPHLNHIPDPFVLDDLVTSEDGAWVSGQANQADGLHYTPEMYKAIAITAARNFYNMAF